MVFTKSFLRESEMKEKEEEFQIGDLVKILGFSGLGTIPYAIVLENIKKIHLNSRFIKVKILNEGVWEWPENLIKKLNKKEGE